MLADEQRRISSVGAPAHGAVEELLVLEAGEERRDGLADRGFGGVGVGIRRVLCVRTGDRDEFRGRSAEGLMLLEAGKTGEFVAYFYDTVPGNVRIRSPRSRGLGLPYSLGSKKKPRSPLYTTGASL